MCLTSINEYDAADINAKAYTDATTERCLALLLSHPDDDDDDESSHEVFKSNLAPLAQNLGLTPAKAVECKESALKQVVKTFLMQQQEKQPSSSTADLVRRAGDLLGLDSSEFTEDGATDGGSGAVATDATTAEKLRRFSGEVDTIVSKFVDDTSPRATAAAELESAVKLFGGRGTEAVETVVEVVAGKAVKAAKSALQFEEKNDMVRRDYFVEQKIASHHQIADKVFTKEQLKQSSFY
jgi:hypothetical protein